jgi:hypothetical protein
MKPHQNWLNLAAMAAVIVGISAIVIKNLPGKVAHQLVNVSYDPTRELYQALNPAFATSYEKETGVMSSSRNRMAARSRRRRHARSIFRRRRITKARSDFAELGGEIAEPFPAMHLDHRYRRASGQSPPRQGLAGPSRPWS